MPACLRSSSAVLRAPVAASVLTTLSMIAPTARAQWLEPDAHSLRTVDTADGGDLFGWLVLPLGDVNSDGVPDFAAGAPFAGFFSEGFIGVYSGATGGEIWHVNGVFSSGILGYTLERFRDFDGDGAMDFFAAAPFNGASGGVVYLYSGRTGAVIHPFQIQPNSNFGTSISASGDFNGDGVNDIAIGAPGDDTIAPNAGRVYVYSGVDFSLITAIDPPESGFGSFGDGVEFIGDITAPPDGRAELAAGIRLVGTNPPGRIYALSLHGTSVNVRYTIDNVSLSSPLESDRVTGGQDLNGDGINDLLVGQLDLSIATIYSGANGSVIRTITGDASTSFGSGSLIPDIDADGVPDVILGARLNDAGATNGGKIFLYSGATGALLRTMTCTSASRSFGADAKAFADLNGDGAIDFVVGASGSSMGGPGRVEIMAGVRPPCRADIAPAGGNNVVDVNDLLAVISSWGACPAPCPPHCAADIAPAGTGNCSVDVNDLLMVVTHWGACP